MLSGSEVGPYTLQTVHVFEVDEPCTLRASLSATYVGNQCLEFANHAVTVTNRWVRCSFRVHSTVFC